MGRVTDELEAEGKAVSIENQNSFTLQGRTAALGGKPDLITVYEGVGTIIEAKTGAPSPAHHAQAMIYMYAVPKSLPQYEGLTFDGKVVYQDHEEHIPSSAIDQTFHRQSQRADSPSELGHTREEGPKRDGMRVLQHHTGGVPRAGLRRHHRRGFHGGFLVLRYESSNTFQ